MKKKYPLDHDAYPFYKLASVANKMKADCYCMEKPINEIIRDILKAISDLREATDASSDPR